MRRWHPVPIFTSSIILIVLSELSDEIPSRLLVSQRYTAVRYALQQYTLVGSPYCGVLYFNSMLMPDGDTPQSGGVVTGFSFNKITSKSCTGIAC